MGAYRLVIDNEVNAMVKECKIEYRAAHPEMAKIPLSNNKIIYQMAKFYLDNDVHRRR